MAVLIALIGGNEFRPNCEPMDRALLARLAAEPIVVILPTAAAHENPRLAADNGVRYFRRLGAQACQDRGGVNMPESGRRREKVSPGYSTIRVIDGVRCRKAS